MSIKKSNYLKNVLISYEIFLSKNKKKMINLKIKFISVYKYK